MESVNRRIQHTKRRYFSSSDESVKFALTFSHLLLLNFKLLGLSGKNWLFLQPFPFNKNKTKTLIYIYIKGCCGVLQRTWGLQQGFGSDNSRVAGGKGPASVGGEALEGRQSEEGAARERRASESTSPHQLCFIMKSTLRYILCMKTAK